MRRILYYDCFAGMSGDMNLAALIDLGVPLDYLLAELSKLGLDGEFEIRADKALKGGMTGTKLHVHAHDHGHAHHHHRNWTDIRSLISRSGLKDEVKQQSIRIFEALAIAEGKVHGKAPEEVHFHEVGAVDSIVDIVGACIAIDHLACDQIYSSTIELGSGTVRCAHGIMPVPAPATLLLSQAFPSSIGGTDHEATTPTGAAFLATLVDRFNPSFEGHCLATGTGIGHRDSDKRPNILRVSLFEAESSAHASRNCILIEANIDDMTPEHLSYLCEKLAEAGTMDVWQESITMKKGRLGTKVCVLASPESAPQLRSVLFRHSTTLGLREIPIAKYELERDMIERTTPHGAGRIKRAYLEGEIIKEKAEFDDCRQLANEHNLTIGEITDTLQREC